MKMFLTNGISGVYDSSLYSSSCASPTSAASTVAVVAVLWAQMRFIRSCIQMRRHGCDLRMYTVEHPHAVIAMIACVTAMIFPSQWTLMFVLATTLVYDWINAPIEVDNGGTLELASSAILLAEVSSSNFGASGASFGSCIPWMKFSFCSIYFAAAFAKLNTDYFDWRLSSNTAFTMQLLASPPFLGDRFGLHGDALNLSDHMWKRILMIALVALEIVEFAIPILIYISPALGVVVDWLFHLIVGMAAYDFSSIGIVILPLMLKLCALESAFGWMTTSTIARLIMLGFIAVLVVKYTPEVPGQSSMKNGHLEKTELHGTWLLWACCCGVSLLYQMDFTETFSLGRQQDDIAANMVLDLDANDVPLLTRCAYTLVSLFVLLTCLAPYLGLKTSSTFSMFSNLRVEGGHTNHFLWRPSWAIFPLVSDLVTVTASNLDSVRFFMRIRGPPEELASMTSLLKRLHIQTAIYGNSKMGGGGTAGGTIQNSVFPYRVPYIQLRELISQATEENFIIEYTRRGQAHRFEVQNGNVISGDRKLVKKLNIVFHKWMFCRSIDLGDRGLCYV